MVNCLNLRYEQLDPTAYGWESKNDGLQPKWFEGNALPTEEELNEMFQESENTYTFDREQQYEANSDESDVDSNEDDNEASEYEEDD